MVADIKDIMKVLPHRPPFLLIDRLEELEEGYLYYKGYRNVNLRIIKIKKSAIQGNLYFCSQEIKKIMQDRVIPYL